MYLGARQEYFKQGKHCLNGKGERLCIFLDSLTVHLLIVCNNERSL